MRAMFVASPMVGHVLPLVPLAAAFRDAGHDVVVATGADGVDAARRAGLSVGDVAPAVHVGKVIGGVLLRHPVHVLRMVGGDNGTDGVGRIFAAITARMADPTLALATRRSRMWCCTRVWRPSARSRPGVAASRRCWWTPSSWTGAGSSPR